MEMVEGGSSREDARNKMTLSYQFHLGMVGYVVGQGHVKDGMHDEYARLEMTT